jgi:hypothetical protein
MIEIVCVSLNFEEDFSIATQSKQNKEVVLLKVQDIFFQFRFIPFQEIFHKVKLYSSPPACPHSFSTCMAFDGQFESKKTMHIHN